MLFVSPGLLPGEGVPAFPFGPFSSAVFSSHTPLFLAEFPTALRQEKPPPFYQYSPGRCSTETRPTFLSPPFPPPGTSTSREFTTACGRSSRKVTPPFSAKHSSSCPSLDHHGGLSILCSAHPLSFQPTRRVRALFFPSRFPRRLDLGRVTLESHPRIRAVFFPSFIGSSRPPAKDPCSEACRRVTSFGSCRFPFPFVHFSPGRSENRWPSSSTMGLFTFPQFWGPFGSLGFPTPPNHRRRDVDSSSVREARNLYPIPHTLLLYTYLPGMILRGKPVRPPMMSRVKYELLRFLLRAAGATLRGPCKALRFWSRFLADVIGSSPSLFFYFPFSKIPRPDRLVPCRLFLSPPLVPSARPGCFNLFSCQIHFFCTSLLWIKNIFASPSSHLGYGQRLAVRFLWQNVTSFTPLPTGGLLAKGAFGGENSPEGRKRLPPLARLVRKHFLDPLGTQDNSHPPPPHKSHRP